MLDRIRRKLFLSLKVMTSTPSSSPTEDNSQLKTTELMDILRKGSSALSRSDVGMDLGTFLDAPIQQILDDSREREGVRDAKLKKELVSSHDVPDDTAGAALEIDEKVLLDAEEEERRLLSGVAQVQSRLFEGKFIKRNQNNSQIAQEWQELQKRARVDRTVVVDGITVIADHMGQTVVRVVFLFSWTVLILISPSARGGKSNPEEAKEGKVRIRGLVHLLSRWRRCRHL